MYTVMTVCTGNICRSPMAEIILRTEFERRGLADKVNVESSGVSDEEYGFAYACATASAAAGQA